MSAQKCITSTIASEYSQPSFSGIPNCEVPNNTDGSTPPTYLGDYSWWTYLKRYVWHIFSVVVNRTASLFSTNHSIIPHTEIHHISTGAHVDTCKYHDNIICTDATTPLDCTVIWDSASDSRTTQNSNHVLNHTPTLEPFSVFLSEFDQEDIAETCHDTQLSPTTAVHPTSHTLLTTCYVDAKNGVIDEETRDHLVQQVITSVLPRNLSDCSEIFVKPHIRRMYAWTKPDKSIPAELDDNFGENTKPIGMAAATDDATNINTSCTSFSPLSPGTDVSTTPTGEICRSLNECSGIQLPDLDKHGHTLAWAMSNMQLSTGKYAELPTFEDVERMDSINSGAPSSPPSSLSRPSRDKSAVSTVNSSKRSEEMCLPTFTPIEETQFAKSLYDCELDVPKPKRSSSLKSRRTPPGTPKAVRFADAFGLDLATVKHVFDQEVPPRIPASATFDLDLDTDESIAKLGAKQFGLCFAQPGSAPNFIHRVFSQTVCLEDAHVDMPRGVLTGTIRVRSLGFEKRVYSRITYNNWMTFFDTLASYVQGSHDGATDRFSFSIVFPDIMTPGDKAQFAIRYEAHTGEQFWDNNHGRNYTVTCYAKATDLAGDGSWVHYL